MSRNGLEHTPKTTRVNLSTMISGFVFSMSSIHKNLSTSLSSSAMLTIGNAFSTSPVSAILLARNLRRMSKMFSARGGPVYKQSFKTAPLDLAEASYTTLNLVVVLSRLITAWCGR